MFKEEKNKFTKVDSFQLKYTICFCHRGNLVLMIFRKNEPNKNLWNGLGGKINTRESPLISVKREMLEEAHIDLNHATDIYYAGIVTWNQEGEKNGLGMYAFVVDLPGNWPIWKGNKTIPEGILSWKPIEWACSLDNTEVVENIPHFLPPMLKKEIPKNYHFVYQGKKIMQTSTHILPSSFRV